MIRAAVSRAPGAPAEEIDFERAVAWLAAGDDAPDEVLWIDCAAPDEGELAGLEKVLGLHPLTVEDLSHRNQRAKLEEYPGYLFIVLHWLPGPEATHHPHELHCVLGRNWLATVYDDRRMDPVEETWAGFLRGRSRPPSGADGELYRVLDHLVDSHRPLMGVFEDRLDRLTTRAAHGGEQGDIDRLVAIRRSLVRFRRALSPQRDVLSALARREHELISQRSLFYFRDVSDHLYREYEALEQLRELAQSVMEVQLAVIERHQNQVIQRLTVLSTVFLPLTFLTGFFGMNFLDMPFDDARLFAAAVAAMALLPSALLWWLRSKGWLANGK